MCILGFIMGILPAEVYADEFGGGEKPVSDNPNSGNQAIKNNIVKLNLEYQFVNIPDNAHQDIYTIRTDYIHGVTSSWQANLRLDVPFVYGNKCEPDNLNSQFQFGLGDLLTQGGADYRINDRISLGGKVRLYWPTASYDQGGTGKYRVMPIVHLTIALPEISNGSNFEPEVRYDTSYAGSPERKNIQKIEFAPALKVMFPDEFFFVLYSSPEIVYDFKQKAWNVPFNFMIGKKLNKKYTGTMEFYIPMYEGDDDMKSYNFKTEVKLTIAF